MVDDRPSWARRMANERHTRGSGQADAVQAMRAHAPVLVTPGACQPGTSVEAVGGW